MKDVHDALYLCVAIIITLTICLTFSLKRELWQLDMMYAKGFKDACAGATLTEDAKTETPLYVRYADSSKRKPWEEKD